MLFVETKIFTRLLPDYLSDEEYKDFQTYLAANPVDGNIMQGTGGLRKARWKSKGKGKRSGVRIIYYFHSAVDRIYLLTLYAKNEVTSLGPEECKALRKLVEEWNI
ncbi:MAG: type II toxin-antitoxin system RelE/ParE family toxin [Nitrospirae bacterium]|nr:type II toxin-antitoxin system RelE/ParE family toxin [Nitrospirota bacterium]